MTVEVAVKSRRWWGRLRVAIDLDCLAGFGARLNFAAVCRVAALAPNYGRQMLRQLRPWRGVRMSLSAARRGCPHMTQSVRAVSAVSVRSLGSANQDGVIRTLTWRGSELCCCARYSCAWAEVAVAGRSMRRDWAPNLRDAFGRELDNIMAMIS
ncbi:MAG: hypothetical protein JWP58_4598 [Hymenobacter sp.]|nr:hypothetical protein [Hymenobacter sp.]